MWEPGSRVPWSRRRGQSLSPRVRGRGTRLWGRGTGPASLSDAAVVGEIRVRRDYAAEGEVLEQVNRK